MRPGPDAAPRQGRRKRPRPGDHDPPGGYGTWRLATGVPGARELKIALEPIATEECDHRFAARGHAPKCRHEHRLKQDPRWNVEQITPATFRWTTPSGRQYTTEATRYPI